MGSEVVGESQLERFRREDLARVRSLRIAAGLVPLLSIFAGWAPFRRQTQPALSEVDALLERYRAYLISERGLAVVTAACYADMVRPFVTSRGQRGRRVDLGG